MQDSLYINFYSTQLKIILSEIKMLVNIYYC
nr:MAG TPA_asm: hypothetical protein [Caudoviricetes sp.]DAQ09514.1 MAG TPA: hypothetical protein [Caudoviricetes sp.]DAX04706.1 MAG TPA: hypothetical protein [Bacteriophage sp.]